MKTQPKGRDWFTKLDTAIDRLELFLDPTSQTLLQTLEQARPPHLTDISRETGKSPYQIKKRLEKLKAAGFVYHPQRLPKAYAADAVKGLRIRWQTAELADYCDCE